MRIRLIVAAVACLVATQAQAVLLNFSMLDQSGETLVWQMDSQPQPDGFAQLVETDNTKGFALFNGVSVTSTVFGTFNALIAISNGSQTNLPGIIALPRVAILANGINRTYRSVDSVFSGPVQTPVFAPGIFTFQAQGQNDFFAETRGGTLTITSVTTGGVPEPATWLSMIAGFALVGATLRQRRADRAETVGAC